MPDKPVVRAGKAITRRRGSSARSKQTPSIQSLDRGLIILEAVARSSRPVSVAELAELLDVDHSSAFRLANTLKRRGFLAHQSGRKEYVLGPAIWRLSHRYDWSKMLVMIAHEYLKLLGSQTGETVHLAVREGKQALFIDHITANHVISVSGQTGELVPLYCTAHGKALLADHDKAQLQALFGAGPLETRTKRTIVSIDRMARVCAQIKAQCFATDDGELVDGIRCVAAPIRDKDGTIVGSIGISAPVARFPEEHFSACGEQVAKVAQQISDLLGTPTEENSDP
jgi:IclR family transcriptional regulator, acetate operon repressor